MADTQSRTGWGFTELLLAGVIALSGAGVALGLALYVLPAPAAELEHLNPTIRVARADDVPVGASRLVRWGERIVLVVHADSGRFVAVQGADPRDGCILQWEEEAARIVSPCTYSVYDRRGNVVTGLTTQPLARYHVFVRDGVVYVTEA